METPKNFLSRYNSLFKAAFVFFLALLLMIPNSMIRDIIREREWKQEEALQDISNSWGREQTLSGPVLSIPYYEKVKTKDALDNIRIKKVKKHLQILPDKLLIDGEVITHKRYRGIYEIVVYNSVLNFKGGFQDLDLPIADVPFEQFQFEDAFLTIGINDTRGLQEQIEIDWNGKEQMFNPGTEPVSGIAHGLHVPVNIAVDTANKSVKSQAFSFNVKIKGSKNLNFIPTGKETKVSLNSPWATPSFNGNFLPDRRVITENGFEASWNVLHLNRHYPQAWIGKAHKIEHNAFGVGLLLPVDNYQKSTRAIKYAFLFICLTFLAFFFIEIMKKVNIHPIQYILVGLALCIFYTLLVSISEQLSFNYAYLIASTMTILLIFTYAKAILKKSSFALVIGGILSLLYGFIFTIIQLEDLSLLVGSVGLFFVLAFIMYFSRHIDWYSMKRNKT